MEVLKIVITVASGTGVVKGQVVTGTNIPTETRVVGVATNDIFLDKPITGGNASGNATFTKNVAEELTIGQAVTKTGGGGQGGPDAFPASTTIIGIDLATQATEFKIIDNSATAMTIAEGSTTYLTFVTCLIGKRL